MKRAPDSLTVAASLNNLGEVANKRGDLAAAETAHQAALTLRQKLSPGSESEASSLYSLGLLARHPRARRAADYFERASRHSNQQTGKLGAPTSASGFAALYIQFTTGITSNCCSSLINQRGPSRFSRCRARSLLAMLVERDLVFAADLPAYLSRDRQLVNTDYIARSLRLRG